MKEAVKSFALSLPYITRLFKTAARVGKGAVIIVSFPGYEVECRITRKVNE